ncbi:sulfurtransferase [Halobacteriales archaeon QS_1_69_70]|nr:MAG: sulfurtransferase [Halobacteriales archaeon QS_1_69_70]
MSEAVVSAGWLADRLGDVNVVDVREAWEYDGIGHVPGAVNVPFDSFRSASAGEAGMLPGADRFAGLMAEAGVWSDDDVVAYDDTHGVFAARLLVTAELYGHDPDRLHLLDGDFSSWKLEHPTGDETQDPPRAEYEAAFRRGGPLVELEAVEAAMDDHDTVLVDTREAWEFEEGHIPGSVRLDWRDLVDDETRGLRADPDLRGLLADAGIVPEKRVLLYCNTARRISHTYTVLRHLEYPDLAFYEGSLTEWEAEGGDLETGV